MLNNVFNYILKEGSEIVIDESIATEDVDVELILNKLISDEILAWMSYYTGAQVIKGGAYTALKAEMLKHAQEELDHAQKLYDRLSAMEMKQITNPREMLKLTNCPYFDASDDTKTQAVVKQQIEAEQCAINAYTSAYKAINPYDPATGLILLEILNDEIEHKDDMTQLKYQIGKE